MALAPKKRPAGNVAGAAKTETTGNTGKVTPGQKRYSSGAPARGTQTRKDILADMQKLVNYAKTTKFKSGKEQKKVWAQIDNYRVALGTLKEKARKSKSDSKGTTTYGAGAIKVRKEAGFSKDTGRGGGRKSTQNGGGGGNGKTTPKTPKPPTGKEPWAVRKPQPKGAAGDWVTTKSGRAELEKGGVKQDYRGSYKKDPRVSKPAQNRGGR